MVLKYKNLEMAEKYKNLEMAEKLMNLEMSEQSFGKLISMTESSN